MSVGTIVELEGSDAATSGRGFVVPAAIGAALLAAVGVAALVVEPEAPRARIAEPLTIGVAVRSAPVLPAVVPERPDRLFIALPLSEIRLRSGALPLVLPPDAGTLLRSGWEGPLGADRWFRGAGVLLDYRIGVSSLTLVARQESVARAYVGRPVSVRNANGIATESSNGALIFWTEGGQRYELASPDLDVVALVRLAATLSADP